MALDKIYLDNFTLFENMGIEISPGINVFIGENGTGKTHIMKVLYAACQSAHGSRKIINFPQKIVQVFRPDGSNIARLMNNKAKKTATAKIQITSGENMLAAEFDSKTKQWDANTTGTEAWEKNLAGLSSTFIPAKEILSNSKNLVNAINAGNVDFDDTYVDIITAASVDISSADDTDRKNQYLRLIEKITNGKVSIKDEKFYLGTSNRQLEFSLVAEGLRKIALLWQLINNGALKKGSVLFWDEPEANINPRNVPLIVDLLLSLQRDGVQIFVATHDYFLAKYLEARKTNEDCLLYHAFYKENGNILHESEEDFALLENNSILSQSIELYKEEVKKMME